MYRKERTRVPSLNAGAWTSIPLPEQGVCLKGQCHEIFFFWFFLWISFPSAPEYPIRTISNFFENSRRYSQVKVHHQCQRHRWPICYRCQRRRWQVATGINDTGGKFAAGVVDTGGKWWEQYQAADTLKWIWRQKFIYMVTLLPKGAQTKLLKFFCLKIFSICHRCRWHRWCTLSREYLREFSKKFEKAVLVYSDASGKLIHEKNQKSKISWHCPFKLSVTRVNASRRVRSCSAPTQAPVLA